MQKVTMLVFLLFLAGVTSARAQFSKCSDCDDFTEFKTALCTKEKVPLHYAPDNKDSISLFVRKFPSLKKRKGSIWLIAGGPGESGASLYPLIDLFSKTFPHLDILIPDHRGTGLSSKICPKEEAVDSPNGIALANEEWGTCFNHMYSNTAYVQAFSITNAAKDLSILIHKLSGEGKRYVYGVSYGTQLVLRLLQWNSSNLDGILLDSLVPLQEDADFDLSHRSFVVNNVGNSVLSYFDAKNSDEDTTLALQLKNCIHKARNEESYARNLPKQDLSVLLGMLLDIPKLRNRIPSIIRALTNENFQPLKDAITELTDFYANYGGKYKTAHNSIPLVQVISSSENNVRPTLKPNEVIAESDSLLFTSILPKLLAQNAMPTYQKDAYFNKVPLQMPPTLILHGTLDPKTHITGAIRHVEKLPKDNPLLLVKVKDAPHFIALFAPNSFRTIAAKFIHGEKIENEEIHDANVLLK